MTTAVLWRHCVTYHSNDLLHSGVIFDTNCDRAVISAATINLDDINLLLQDRHAFLKWNRLYQSCRGLHVFSSDVRYDIMGYN